MPDISLCTTKTCRKRLECFRYRAASSGEGQSWVVYEADEPGRPCASFMQLYPHTRAPLRTPVDQPD